MINPQMLLRLHQRITKEGKSPPRSADLIYLFGQTRENQSSVLDVASNFEGPIGFIGHEGTEASGCPGFAAWRKELLQRGVDDNRIIPVMGCFSHDAAGTFRGNTLTEAAALVRFAKEHNMRSIIIVSTYWHLLRCLMTTVGIVLKEYPSLRVYPALGASLPWEKESVHSQGTLKGSRVDFIITELLRIFEYHEQDHIPNAERLVPSIPTVEAVLKYLDARD